MADLTPRAMSRAGAAVAALLGLTLLAGCAAGGEQATVTGTSDDGYHGAVLTEPYSTPEVALTDTDGAPYDLATDPTTPITLVFFGYTHCPDVCQAVMASVASALTRLEDAQRADVEVVFVTTDPTRDDETRIREWLDRFDPSFIGLTGPLADIEQVAAAYKVFMEKGEKLPTGGYDVSHGTPVLGLMADHEVPIVWTEGTGSAQFATDLIKLLADGPPPPYEEDS